MAGGKGAKKDKRKDNSNKRGGDPLANRKERLKQQRQKKMLRRVGMGALVLLGLLGVFLVGGVLGGLRPVELEGLTELSRPTNAKYKAVLRDEEIRTSLLQKRKSKQDQKEYDEGYKNNRFNQWISDRLSLHRRS